MGLLHGGNKPVFLTRKDAARALGISKKEFASLIETQKIHPVKTAGGQTRVSLAEIISLRGEYAARSFAVPYEKFIKAATCFCNSAPEANSQLSVLGLPTVPVEYIERLRSAMQNDPEPGVIQAQTSKEFFVAFGKAEEILKHPDVKILAELLYMINRGEEEISQAIRAKFGREYPVDVVARYLEYFFNWRSMDPDSIKLYIKFLSEREAFLKTCAFHRADHFIFYALGLDYGGEVADLIERSCLGLLHKLNIYIDGFVYGDLVVGQADIQKLSDIIATLLGAASQVRAGRVAKGKQGDLVDTMIPKAFSRTEFFSGEKTLSFTPPKEVTGA